MATADVQWGLPALRKSNKVRPREEEEVSDMVIEKTKKAPMFSVNLSFAKKKKKKLYGFLSSCYLIGQQLNDS
jgi:hypothetical protein